MKILFDARHLVSSVALLAILLVLPAVAGAGGVGGYLEYSRGDQKVEFKLLPDETFTNNRFGVGMVLDTNVARDELVNIRASLGYVRTENTVDDEAHGGAFDFAIGFGLWRTSALRVWAAPAVRIGIDYYDGDFQNVLDLEFGGGARLGLNWHITSRISVSPSLSYQYMYVRETIKDEFGKEENDGTEHLITARLTFLFRDLADVF